MQRLLVLLVLGAIAFTLNGCGSSNITSTSETSTENQLLLNIQKILKAHQTISFNSIFLLVIKC